MVKVLELPEQPLKEGVTVMVPLIGVVPLLVAVNPLLLPAPLAERPIAVLLFVQE